MAHSWQGCHNSGYVSVETVFHSCGSGVHQRGTCLAQYTVKCMALDLYLATAVWRGRVLSPDADGHDSKIAHGKVKHSIASVSIVRTLMRRELRNPRTNRGYSLLLVPRDKRIQTPASCPTSRRCLLPSSIVLEYCWWDVLIGSVISKGASSLGVSIHLTSPPLGH